MARGNYWYGGYGGPGTPSGASGLNGFYGGPGGVGTSGTGSSPEVFPSTDMLGLSVDNQNVSSALLRHDDRHVPRDPVGGIIDGGVGRRGHPGTALPSPAPTSTSLSEVLAFAPGVTEVDVPVTILAPSGEVGPRKFGSEPDQFADGAAISVSQGVATIGSPISLTADHTNAWANGHTTVVLTATVTAPDGYPADNVPVTFSVTPAADMKLTVNGQPTTTVMTKATGFARIDLTSTVPIPVDGNVPVTITATTPAQGSTSLGGSSPDSATAQVTWVRHKVVIQYVGINTDFECTSDSSSCTSDEPVSDPFGPLRSSMVSNGGFDQSDFLWFSYTGGRIDPTNGAGTRTATPARPYGPELREQHLPGRRQ